jgi:hypothetical protein
MSLAESLNPSTGRVRTTKGAKHQQAIEPFSSIAPHLGRAHTGLATLHFGQTGVHYRHGNTFRAT